MKVEAQSGAGQLYNFTTTQVSSYCPEGIHKIKIPFPEGEYAMTIDNGTNSLGLCFANVENKHLMFSANLQRSLEKSAVDFIKDFEITLRYFIKTINRIAYIKVEEPYNSRDERFANSYAVLKMSFDMIRKVCLENNLIFIPTKPVVWESQYIGEEKKSSGMGAKTLIKNKTKYLYPYLMLKNQDAYDAIGMMWSFFNDDVRDGCFLRMNTSTKITNISNKFATLKIYEINKVTPEIIIKDLAPNAEKYNFTPNISGFGYNSDFSLTENIFTALHYKPKDIIYSIVPIELKLLPVLYQIPNNITNVQQGTPVVIVSRLGRLKIDEQARSKYLEIEV